MASVRHYCKEVTKSFGGWSFSAAMYKAQMRKAAKRWKKERAGRSKRQKGVNVLHTT